MAVLFDTASLAGRDRPEALRTALLEASGSTRVELETPESGVWGQMALWSFGDVADLHLHQQRPVDEARREGGPWGVPGRRSGGRARPR